MSSLTARRVALLLLATLLSACTSQPPIKIDPRPQLLSFDGLSPVVEPDNVDRAWVRPSAKLGGYTKLRLLGDGVQYRYISADDPKADVQIPISKSIRATFEANLTQAIHAELANSQRFGLSQQIGPDVASLWGALVDVNVHRPVESDPKKLALEFTLVIELRDSMSDSTLIRAAKAYQLDITDDEPSKNWARVSATSDSIATFLRETLDSLGSTLSVRAVSAS
ncbi:MAG: hypothetical protein ACR2PZ_26555 [Pseudomonadales bacterium]